MRISISTSISIRSGSRVGRGGHMYHVGRMCWAAAQHRNKAAAARRVCSASALGLRGGGAASALGLRGGGAASAGGVGWSTWVVPARAISSGEKPLIGNGSAASPLATQPSSSRVATHAACQCAMTSQRLRRVFGGKQVRACSTAPPEVCFILYTLYFVLHCSSRGVLHPLKPNLRRSRWRRHRQRIMCYVA